MGFKQYLATFLHLSAFSLYAYAIYFDYSVLNDKMPLWQTFGGRWKFLTWWNVCFQALFFGLSVLNDFTGSSSTADKKHNKRTALQKLNDQYLISIVWPMGIFVVMTFWALYFVDRELVYPEHLDKIIPSWHNHTYHTYVFPFILAELILVYHKLPKRKAGLSLTLLVSLAYLVWVFFVAFYADFWVYPVLEVLSWLGRLVFIGTLLVFITLIYVIGENINIVAWGEPELLKKKA